MSRSGGSRSAGAARDLYCEIEGESVTLRGEDLSTAGFFIETSTPYAMDRELEIYLRSSVGELFARGQVVQVVGPTRARSEKRRPGFGLLFTGLEDDQRAFIGLTLDALTRARAPAKKVPSAPPPKPPSVHPPKAPSTTRSQTAMPAVQASAPARPSAPEQDTAAIKALAGELRAELAKLQGKTAWTALGLEPDSPLGGAKEAFLRLSKRFHPHKFARHNSDELTKLATEVFIAYKRSYDLLSKLAPRTSHEAVRSPQRTVTSISPASPAGPAEAQANNAMRPAGGRPRSR